jgi:hypothetical protein
MTYKIRNISIVFAFAALMLAMPLATPNAQAETVDASLGGICGFTTTNLDSADFGTFVRTDSESGNGLEESITLTAGATNTASARVLVTVADWFTTGTGAKGTIQITDNGLTADTDSVTVGAKTYLAKATGAAGDQFNIGANAVATAQNLATAIRASDAATYRLSTGGTDTISLETVAKFDNNDPLSENTAGARIVTKDAGAVTTSNVLNGAVDTAVLIIDGENTKFAFSASADPTGSYSSKVSTVTLETAQEVLGGTVPANNVFMTIEIDPATATYNAAALPYIGPITQLITISVESACDGT